MKYLRWKNFGNGNKPIKIGKINTGISRNTFIYLLKKFIIQFCSKRTFDGMELKDRVTGKQFSYSVICAFNESIKTIYEECCKENKPKLLEVLGKSGIQKGHVDFWIQDGKTHHILPRFRMYTPTSYTNKHIIH